MQCNYCLMKELELRAKTDGKVLVNKPSDFMDGVDIFFVPEDNVNLPFYGELGEEQVRKKFFFCWVWKIEEVCKC